MLKRYCGWLLTIVFLSNTVGCDTTQPEEPEEQGRGSIVETSLLEHITRERIESYGLSVPLIYDVNLYSIVYRTIDPEGEETLASGAIAAPQDILISMPVLSYQHGTDVLKDGVASVAGLDAIESLIAVIFASNGYLTLMPDYLGLGVSPGLHPYLHAASLATATIDMIRAGRIYAERESLNLNERLFLAGYSEGGFATAATQRLIEQAHAAEFTLTASAPMAGSYDMSGTMLNFMLRREVYGQAYYLPYLLLSYDTVYGLFESPAHIFAPPYTDLIPSLFDGTHSAGSINRQLPSIPVDMFKPEYITAVSGDTGHPLRDALRDNDLYDWTPQAPTRLYHCLDDELVPYENATVAYQRFLERGATQVSLITMDAGGHGDCVMPSLFQAKVWFDSFRISSIAVKKEKDPEPNTLSALY